MDNINDFCGFSPQLIIPTTFEECFTYEEQILYLKQLIEEGGEADLTEIEQRLSAVEASVATLNDEVSQINVDEINTQLQSINADLTELKNKSSTQADSITALQSTVTTQGSEISTVKRQVETQATAVTNLSNSLSTTNSNVTKNTNDIAANTTNIASLQTTVAGKQNTLTFDSTPTSGSTNPVTSDGIRKALAGKQNTLTFDKTPTAGSTNPVTSGGIRKALAGKQNALTFDNTPTTGSTNPVTSDGIRKAIDEAGGASTVEWIETNIDDFIASLPANVTYTTDIKMKDINRDKLSLVPTNMFKGTFTQTGMFISSDKRYVKVVLNVTNATLVSETSQNVSYTADKYTSKRPFTYAAYYVTIREEGGDFMCINSFYSINPNCNVVYSESYFTNRGIFNSNAVYTCNAYFKLVPDMPIDLT